MLDSKGKIIFKRLISIKNNSTLISFKFKNLYTNIFKEHRKRKNSNKNPKKARRKNQFGGLAKLESQKRFEKQAGKEDQRGKEKSQRIQNTLLRFQCFTTTFHT